MACLGRQIRADGSSIWQRLPLAHELLSRRGTKPKKTLLVFHGGYDSILEELYFTLVKDAHDHGYDVLTFNGPGQGSVLTQQKLPFTHEWEKPTSAVMDTFLAHHERPGKMVLIGESMGG
jgi:alpha-beta hydrolase superfamily lysophospholipase